MTFAAGARCGSVGARWTFQRSVGAPRRAAVPCRRPCRGSSAGGLLAWPHGKRAPHRAHRGGVARHGAGRARAIPDPGQRRPLRSPGHHVGGAAPQEGQEPRRRRARPPFKAMGRVIYLAEEMAVAYPGAEVFTPDVLAVLDVVQPEDDERLAWVVADEGRGLDLGDRGAPQGQPQERPRGQRRALRPPRDPRVLRLRPGQAADPRPSPGGPGCPALPAHRAAVGALPLDGARPRSGPAAGLPALLSGHGRADRLGRF